MTMPARGRARSHWPGPLSGVLARLVGLAGILLAIVTFIPAETAPAGASSNGLWSLTPYNAPSKNQAPRFFFDYTLAAGQSIQDRLQLVNLTNHPITFLVYPSDAENVPNGGAFSLNPPTTKPTGVGTWIHSAETLTTVPPHTELIFGFSLTVPAGTGPGDYAGGIVAQDTQPTATRSGNVIVNVKEGIGVRIYIRVAGGVVPGIAINGVKLDSSPRGFFSIITGERTGVIQFRLANTGNARLDAKVSLSVTGTFGGNVGSIAPITITDLLPGSDPIISAKWPDIPELGIYHIHVSVLATVPGSNLTVSATAQSLYIDLPWLALLILILLIVGTIGWFIWRRRRKRLKPLPRVGDSPRQPIGASA